MTAKFKVSSRHPEDLADGRVVEPGQVVTRVDTGDPHNQRLVDEGLLIEVKDKPRNTNAGGND